MTADTIAPTLLRDAIEEAAIRAAEWRAQTDEHEAAGLRMAAVLLAGACCDEKALRMVRAMPVLMRAEIAGATTDDELAALISGEGGQK